MTRKLRLRGSVRRVHGPDTFAGEGRPVAVCLIRNGAYHLDAFFAHHRAIGVERFVFIDNASSDDTAARIMAEPGTAILHTNLRFKPFQNDLREMAARRYAAGGWCLFLDSDELFDFEGSARIGIGGLASHLDAQRCTGMAAQMLEMFPEGPLDAHAHLPYAQAIAAFDHYEIANARRMAYHDEAVSFSGLLETNVLTDDGVEILFGGVRGRVFSEECCLTKHPLVKVVGDVVPGRHPHCSTHLRVAGITGLIRHYKFAGDSFERDRATVAAGTHDHGEDRLRLERRLANPDLTLNGPDARRYEGIGPLLETGFLRSTPAYARWLEGEEAAAAAL